MRSLTFPASGRTAPIALGRMLLIALGPALSITIGRVLTISLALALPIALAGCGSTPSGPQIVESTREEAQKATRASDWNQAAVRWYALFQRNPQQDLEACRESARAFLQMNNAQLANRVLDQGLQLHPKSVDLLELKGRALAKQGFLRAAADSFERVLEIQPERLVAAIELGDARMKLGLESAAARAYESAIAAGANDGAIWTRLARARKASGDIRGSLDAWQMAFEGGVGKPEDLLLGAQTCVDPLLKVRRIEDLEHGLKWLDLILEREPNNAMAHFQTGVLCEATEQDVRAVESYRRAVELDPGMLIALRNLAVLYHELGNHEGVREMVERALSIEEDAERRRALSELLEESGASSG